MRYLSFFLWSLLTLGLCYFLHNPIGQLPALGKIISPSHGFWRLLEGELPALPEEVISKQLKEEVTVVWDENLIPHIYAQNDEDLYFVQGYITASLRLWQMDFQNRAAAGRLSEIVGVAALDFDLKARRMGMELGNEKVLAVILNDPYAKMIYEQYTKGVNVYLSTLKEKDWPLEYRLLDMTPEPWSVDKIAQVATFTARPSTAEPNNDIAFTNFLKAYNYIDWELLYGGPDNKENPIVDTPGRWGFKPIVPKKKSLDIINGANSPSDEAPDGLKQGSNAWAITSRKSESGHALLVNDSHEPLVLPGAFITHLHSPNFNIIGFCAPGVPSPLSGFNDHIAYAATNAQQNLSDWYKVKFTDSTKSKIFVDNEEVAVTRKIQEIKIKGKESVHDTIYYSDFGVIANHKEFDTEGNEAWAYRWIAQDTSRVGIAIIEMSKAKNWEEFSKATDKFDSPHKTYAYADVEGNVGIRVLGRGIVRQKNEGLFLRDGTRSHNIWTDFIPVDHNIQQYNPERGFINSSNQFPADTTYPYILNAWLYESHRHKRINGILRADSLFSIEDMKKLQLDTYNSEASENLDYFLSMLNYEDLSSDEAVIFNKLKSWNYSADPGLKAQVYYKIWTNTIKELAWDELDKDVPVMVKPSQYRTHKLLKERPNLKWWDIDSTAVIEDAQKLIEVSFRSIMEEVRQWRDQNPETEFNWANFKGTSVTHLTQLPALSQENLFIGGDFGIINATGKTWGPVVRTIVDLDPEGPKAWTARPGGQSGNPGSLWYGNDTEPWANGDYFEIDLGYNEDNPNRLFISLFKPAEN